jgi:hypothetical protein
MRGAHRTSVLYTTNFTHEESLKSTVIAYQFICAFHIKFVVLKMSKKSLNETHLEQLRNV